MLGLKLIHVSKRGHSLLTGLQGKLKRSGSASISSNVASNSGEILLQMPQPRFFVPQMISLRFHITVWVVNYGISNIIVYH